MRESSNNGGALRAPIARIFVQQNSGGEASDTSRSTTSKAVSVEAPIGLCSGVPFARIVIGWICHAYPGAKSGREKSTGAECRLHEGFELINNMHRLKCAAIGWEHKWTTRWR